MAELVIDVPSLLANLAELAGDSLLAGERIEPLKEGDELVGLRVDDREIRAQRIVLSAGAGTEALLQALGLSQPAMQRRPLHMVMAKGPNLKPLYAHCLGGGPKPRVTVTTHPAADGQWVWYLGIWPKPRGRPRACGADRRGAKGNRQPVAMGRPEPSSLGHPACRPRRTCAIRPGTPGQRLLADQQRLLVGWPTKLALAPDFADRVLASLDRDGIRPTAQPDLADLPRPRLACLPGSNCCHEPADPARPPSPAGQHRPEGLAAGPGHRQAWPGPGRQVPHRFHHSGDDEARLLLAQARELGINLIDTAPAYGRSEERLGPLLRGQRDEWVIVSKVGEEFEDGQSRFDFSAAHTRLSVERSLRRLETDRIELVLVHSDGNDLAILEQQGVYQTLAELKQEGKILGYGLSGKTVAGGLKALEQGDCAMVTYNLNEQAERPVLDYAAEHGKAIR